MRKARETIDKEIDEFWTQDELYNLKDLANSILDGLYPGVISPLVETDDIAGSYLNSSTPYTVGAAMTYVSWCIHKYPPYPLKLDESLATKRLNSFWRYKEGSETPVEMTPSIKGNLAHNIIDSLDKNFMSFSKKPIEKLDGIKDYIDEIYLTEDLEFNKQYEIRKSDFLAKRKDKLKSSLKKINKNKLIEHFETNTEFNKIFGEFNSQFQIKAGKNTEIAQPVIKYRFLLHIILLFLRVAGYERGIDYTPYRIKEYRDSIKSSPFLRNIRNELETLSVKSTLPDKRELRSIRKNAKSLLEMLNGRSQNYDLMLYLEQLVHAKSEDFTLNGRISSNKNLTIRAFIKSLAMFFSLYHYDYLTTYSMILSENNFSDEYEKFIENTNNTVKNITEIFFYEVNTAYIKMNTDEIYKEIKDKISLNTNINEITIPESSDDGRILTEYLKASKGALSINPDLLCRIKNTNDSSQSIDEQKQRCNEILINTSTLNFWNELFEFYGQVNPSMGTVELHKLKLPVYSQDELDDHIELSAKVIKQRKIEILKGIKSQIEK